MDQHRPRATDEVLVLSGVLSPTGINGAGDIPALSKVLDGAT